MNTPPLRIPIGSHAPDRSGMPLFWFWGALALLQMAMFVDRDHDPYLVFRGSAVVAAIVIIIHANRRLGGRPQGWLTVDDQGLILDAPRQCWKALRIERSAITELRLRADQHGWLQLACISGSSTYPVRISTDHLGSVITAVQRLGFGDALIESAELLNWRSW